MKIDAYSFGRIVVNGREYTSDLIIYPERARPEWRFSPTARPTLWRTSIGWSGSMHGSSRRCI
ncbi:hypothetical protein [Desulfuromonas sp. TF]|uniref:hypothetical protein n=1 Tax=Desulfuromonas sp. TF TaxID=1232410 RepID=UPI00138AEC46|nr:hypothetical protein [Desulfuromonas sp. TF]